MADFLWASGYEILARNLRLGPLELDLVARLGGLVAIVEVKTRGAGAQQGAFASFTRTKSERVRRAVRRLWRETLAGLDGVERVRVDVAAVVFEAGETRVEYVEGVLAGGSCLSADPFAIACSGAPFGLSAAARTSGSALRLRE